MKCQDCQYVKIINDPDPHDWFNDDDVAIVCTLTPNPDIQPNSEYRSDRHINRSIGKSLRPTEVNKCLANTPKWCPLL